MPPRLSEQYQRGDAVEIYFVAHDAWRPALVYGHESPGVWVRTADGRFWFVTNSRRIRPSGPEPDDG